MLVEKRKGQSKVEKLGDNRKVCASGMNQLPSIRLDSYGLGRFAQREAASHALNRKMRVANKCNG